MSGGATRLRPIAPGDDAAVAAIIRRVMTEFGACGAGFAIHDAEVDAMCAAYSGPRSAYFVCELDDGAAAGVADDGAAGDWAADSAAVAGSGAVDGGAAGGAGGRGTRVIGGGGIGPLAGAPADVCELRKMYFLPEARGRGLGAALLDRCLESARAAGYRTCYLETLTGMDAAQRLYERAGFRRIGGPLGATGHHGCDRWYCLDLAPRAPGPP